ncbi:hypothetical protein OSB04_013189 [Centaurea solstitialis]|uniref:CCHC-type domain-containing protein n=1 Tax=Centaurea solstitialis TaxID=347529 RepID=A0AA38WN47_9ASTR|nr:hypothetical protein OSB04_013189 [Centaurea solstitialis]
MASTVTSTNNLSLRSILEKDKLTGSNFLDWECNLMIVLRHERKWYVLEEPLGEAPPANAPAAARNAHKKHSDDLLDVACLMLATMSPDLQAGLINTNAYDMIRQLRDMFQTQARTERYDATKAFNECKMVKGTSVSDHVMKMKRHLDHLERLGHPVPLQLATDTILNSLSEDYMPFVVNYNMNNMEKTIAELHSMLKTTELNMGNKNKTKDVLMVKDGGVKKKNGHASTSKGKGPVQAIQSAPKKGKSKGKGKKVKPNKARTENRCFTCNEVGHWRQNCPKRHEAGSYDQLLNNSYKCCRLKVAQIFDRVANIGRDPRLRLLLGISHKIDKPSDYTSNVARHLRVTPVRAYKSNKLNETRKWEVFQFDNGMPSSLGNAKLDLEREFDKYDDEEEDCRSEVDIYLADGKEKRDERFDLLGWWKANSVKFPILSQVARHVLAMPISTVASESAFSTGGRVIDKYRSSLNPKTAEALICIQDWIRSSPADIELLDMSIASIEELNEKLENIEIDELPNEQDTPID